MTYIISKYYCPEEKAYVPFTKCADCGHCTLVRAEYVVCNHPKAKEIPEPEKYKR